MSFSQFLIIFTLNDTIFLQTYDPENLLKS